MSTTTRPTIEALEQEIGREGVIAAYHEAAAWDRASTAAWRQQYAAERTARAAAAIAESIEEGRLGYGEEEDLRSLAEAYPSFELGSMVTAAEMAAAARRLAAYASAVADGIRYPAELTGAARTYQRIADELWEGWILPPYGAAA